MLELFLLLSRLFSKIKKKKLNFVSKLFGCHATAPPCRRFNSGTCIILLDEWENLSSVSIKICGIGDKTHKEEDIPPSEEEGGAYASGTGKGGGMSANSGWNVFSSITKHKRHAG